MKKLKRDLYLLGQKKTHLYRQIRICKVMLQDIESQETHLTELLERPIKRPKTLTLNT